VNKDLMKNKKSLKILYLLLTITLILLYLLIMYVLGTIKIILVLILALIILGIIGVVIKEKFPNSKIGKKIIGFIDWINEVIFGIMAQAGAGAG